MCLMDKITGSILGGAIGDALGYTVEFKSYNEIINLYGNSGINMYEYEDDTGKALISDDTQMSLFTAEALLRCDKNKITDDTLKSIFNSYLDWLNTQAGDRFYKCKDGLMSVKEMYASREPGRTCINVLAHKLFGTIEKPINCSKGCGGIMRTAPIALYYNPDIVPILQIDKLAAQASALTHGHKLGYIPSAIFAHILNTVTYRGYCLENAVLDAISAAKVIFGVSEDMDYIEKLINLAVEYSNNNLSDIENINVLGEGWVAEETLAIALYCALKYQNNFSAAVIAAVNHSGDSDSTGAVAGNIVGGLVGFNSISQEWKHNLELYDIIIDMAHKLAIL